MLRIRRNNRCPLMKTPPIRKTSAVDQGHDTDAIRDATIISQADEQDLLSEDGQGNLPMPPEIVTPVLDILETWDEAPGSFGHRVGRLLPDDEAGYSQSLVEEGLDEAEEDLRSLEDQQLGLETKDEELED